MAHALVRIYTWTWLDFSTLSSDVSLRMSSVAVSWQFPATIHLRGGHKTPTHGQSRTTFGEQQAEVKHRSTKSKALYKLPFGYGELTGCAVLQKKKSTQNKTQTQMNIFIKWAGRCDMYSLLIPCWSSLCFSGFFSSILMKLLAVGLTYFKILYWISVQF